MNITYESRYEVYTRLSFLDADQNMTSCHSLNLRTNAIVKSREDYLIPREFSAGYVVYSPTPYLIAGVALGALVGLFLHWLWL
jgi:hypothetical protein